MEKFGSGINVPDSQHWFLIYWRSVSHTRHCIGGDPEVHPGEEEGVREEAGGVRAAEGGRDGGVQGGGGRREGGTAQEVWADGAQHCHQAGRTRQVPVPIPILYKTSSTKFIGVFLSVKPQLRYVCFRHKLDYQWCLCLYIFGWKLSQRKELDSDRICKAYTQRCGTGTGTVGTVTFWLVSSGTETGTVTC